MKPEVMDLAIEQSRHLRDGEALRLRGLREQQQHLAQQLAQLTDYADETCRRWVAPQRVIPAGLLHNHDEFMARLQSAIQTQQQAMVQAEQQIDDVIHRLTRLEQRVGLLEAWQEKKHRALQKQQARAEQKTSDEIGQRLLPPRLRLSEPDSGGFHDV